MTNADLLGGVRDGAWLSQQDFGGVLEASELLASGRCSPQCLLAYEPGSECECRCRREFHGALANTLVPAQPRRPWYARYCGWAQMLLDEQCPVIPGGVQAFNRYYREAKRAHEPFAAVQRRGNTWETCFDAETEQWDSHLNDEATGIWGQVVVALIRARRLRSASGGHSLLHAYGVKDPVEAQVLGTIARELLCGNLDGARSCLRALTEDGFARAEP